MLATPINNTLYGCKNWRLAIANTHGIQPDAPERDAPEGFSQHYLTLGPGQMEHCEPEWICVRLPVTPLYEVSVHECSSI